LAEGTKPEMERRKFRAIKGVRDILPPATDLWNWFEKTARNVMESYNFHEIRLPIFEETELFARAVGVETEVVSKEMYTFLDPPHDLDLEPRPSHHRPRPEPIPRLSDMDPRVRISLRPEATASVARAYIEHGMHTLPGNAKLYYIGPMFRRERPQKGRYRQFYQIGAEVLGTSDAPAIDAEVIEMLTDLLDRCQIEKWTLLVNSIGCANCRPKYVEALREALRKVKDRLGPDSQRRIETNPLRVLDSKLPEEQPIIEKELPKITDYLCDDCRAHFAKLKQELALREVPFTESPRLVRGLDYYTRTTFEITSPVLGAQNALCGGGRYDGLVDMLGGPAGIKGIGFALGEDRFIDAIEEAKKIHATRPLDVFIAWMGEKAYPTAVRLAHVLRGEKHTVELPPEEMKFRKALERADKLKARFALILGEDEIKSGQVTLKDLAKGQQETIDEEALVDYFRPRHE
jgi:histidyl-tRNA synthetase